MQKPANLRLCSKCDGVYNSGSAGPDVQPRCTYDGSSYGLDAYKTCDIVDELKKRDGVEHINVNVESYFHITNEGLCYKERGPAVILVVFD